MILARLIKTQIFLQNINIYLTKHPRCNISGSLAFGIEGLSNFLSLAAQAGKNNPRPLYSVGKLPAPPALGCPARIWQPNASSAWHCSELNVKQILSKK